MESTLSPKQLAEVVGVSESSLKRWADQGKLSVSRTAGGHRRIPVSEAVRFARAMNLPIHKPAALGLPELSAGRASTVTDPARLGELLYDHLRRGEESSVRGTLLELYLAGYTIAWLCDYPLREAMSTIGQLYEHDRRGIYLEHRATDICLRTLHLLRSLIRPAAALAEAPAPQAELDTDPAPAAPVAIGGAVSGDPYLMPSLMAACTLAEVGFEATNLGPDLPVEAILEAAEDHQPRLVWLACSVTTAVPTSRTLLEFAEQLAQRHAAVALGGRGFDAVGIGQHENLHRCGTMGELAAFARGLIA